jgi:phospholipid/cholesterol/gamma-HCH transport system substrate-binding protein
VKKGISRYGSHALALSGMIILALAVGAYITAHQRLHFPWEKRMEVIAEFSTAQSVTPGQGQTVTVAGVEVGEIGEVKLHEGRARVTMVLEPDKLGPIYSNARLLLRPKTGLNDMSIDLDPGTPQRGKPDRGELHDGDVLPVWNTLPNVNPDEVLAALDADTRRYLTIVATVGGAGIGDRGVDLRRVLAASQPTLRSTRRVTRALADRRAKVERLVHNLRLLSQATADSDKELVRLVDGSSAVFDTVGSHDAQLAASVERLPGALSATRDALTETRGLADELAPTARELRPAVRELGPALVDVRPLLRDAAPILRDDLRPLVREATPLVRDLRPSVARLNPATRDLVRTGDVLNYVVNELGYNPPGPEEGYLFWVAWFNHNAASILSIEDAHGATWRGLVMVGCSSLGAVLGSNPALAPLLNAPVCPGAKLPTLQDLVDLLPPLPAGTPLPKGIDPPPASKERAK